MLSLPIQHERIYFINVAQPEDLLPPKQLKQKKKSYHDQHPIDHFIPLAIEVFGFLNKQVDVFLHNCANAMWNFKGP